ncbi:MAG: hypothetical protein Q9183_001991 [Haloplaca sp. 2 TL-2023]
MFSRRLYSPLLLTLLTTSTHPCSAAPPLDPNSDPTECSCYQVPGNERAWFLNHQFFDFREAEDDNVTARFTPALIDNDQDRGIEPITSPFFGEGQFGNYFTPASWTKNATEDAPVHLVNSHQNLYLSKSRDSPDSPVHLTLRTNRLRSFQSTSGLETTELSYLFASIRLRARVAGSHGACAGLFTYHSDDQESDIEILTRDDTSIMRATNQPGLDAQGKVIPEASASVPIPGIGSDNNGSWTEWNDYQLNWLPGQSEWIVNGISVWNKTYGVPTEPSNIQIRMWSDGSAWPGNMTVGGIATFDIQWIDMVYNTSNEAPGASCESICSVDDVANDPVPQVLSRAEVASGAVHARRIGMVSAVLLGILWVTVLP